MHTHHSDHHHAEHERGGGEASGRHRARRGAVRIAILTLLDERPMHGYEIITELETRSDGRWRPSPGPSIRPSRRWKTTAPSPRPRPTASASTSSPTGAARLLAEIASANEDGVEPWNQHGTGGRGELRRLTSEIGGQVRQDRTVRHIRTT